MVGKRTAATYTLQPVLWKDYFSSSLSTIKPNPSPFSTDAAASRDRGGRGATDKFTTKSHFWHTRTNAASPAGSLNKVGFPPSLSNGTVFSATFRLSPCPPLGYMCMLERWEKKTLDAAFFFTSTSYICPSSSSISLALLLRPRFAALINQVLSFLPFLPQSFDSLACKRMKMPFFLPLSSLCLPPTMKGGRDLLYRLARCV